MISSNWQYHFGGCAMKKGMLFREATAFTETESCTLKAGLATLAQSPASFLTSTVNKLIAHLLGLS